MKKKDKDYEEELKQIHSKAVKSKQERQEALEKYGKLPKRPAAAVHAY